MINSLACESFHNNEEEKWFEIILKCTELVSVNSAHGINVRNRVVFDQPWLRQFKAELADQLVYANPRGNCSWIDPSELYFLAIKFILKSQFFNRDLDNVIKYSQDQLAEACYINDSHIIELHSWKNFRPGDWEYLIIRFGISNYDYTQFR